MLAPVAVLTFSVLSWHSGKRPDGRSATAKRELEGEVSVLPFVHGSCLVDLGHTQALCTIALVSHDSATIFTGHMGGTVKEVSPFRFMACTGVVYHGLSGERLCNYLFWAHVGQGKGGKLLWFFVVVYAY